MVVERRVGQGIVIESPRGERIRVVRASNSHLRVDPLPSGWRVFAEELTETLPSAPPAAPPHAEPFGGRDVAAAGSAVSLPADPS